MTETLQHYDIAIVGAGLVGMSLVTALAKKNFKIAILEKNIPESLTTNSAESRPLALSYSSQQILQTLGLWSGLAEQATAIDCVQVSEEGRLGQLWFTAEECRVAALGYVVPLGELQKQLYPCAVKHAEVIHSDELLKISLHDKAQIAFRNSQGPRNISANLLDASDGTQSICRELLGIKVKTTDPAEIAWIAEIKLRRAHQQRAYQRFMRDGILALLPLADAHTMRLVWTLPVASMMKLTTDAIKAHCQTRIGEIQAIKPLGQYPLITTIAEKQIKSHAVVLGNAAHTLYPLAAQGFNLGLRNVAVLSELLTEAAAENIGDITLLKKYFNSCEKNQISARRLTTGLHDLFSLQLPLLGHIRGIGLLTTDLIPPLKRRLARSAMGLDSRFTKLQRGIPL